MDKLRAFHKHNLSWGSHLLLEGGVSTESKTGVVIVDLEAVREVGRNRGDAGVYVLRSKTGAVAGNKSLVDMVGPLFTGGAAEVTTLETRGVAESVVEKLNKGCSFHPVWV